MIKRISLDSISDTASGFTPAVPASKLMILFLFAPQDLLSATLWEWGEERGSIRGQNLRSQSGNALLRENGLLKKAQILESDKSGLDSCPIIN